ncbi:IclR family transcriptional regulator [Xanthobacter sp. KR7-225]|uniref:IclR family transcriptional regulator n=1 Tax=Xanthobacter sp. KR7-225 TaxID=3156613 RepID=UPI0032B5B374
MPAGLDREPRSAGRAPTNTVTGAQSIHRAFGVLRLLANSGAGGVRLTEIAQDLGLTPPTAYRILQVLMEEGAVERLPSERRYVVGAEVALLGLSIRARVGLQEIAEPILTRLCGEVGDAVFLTVRSGYDSVCADRRIGTYPVQVLSIGVGSRRPLGVSVGGMAILSALPPAKASAILAANAARFAPYKMSLDTLAARLAKAREQGFVYADPAIVRSTRALAMPVYDSVGNPACAISTIAIRQRLPVSRTAALVNLFRRAAAELSAALGAKARRRD